MSLITNSNHKEYYEVNRNNHRLTSIILLLGITIQLVEHYNTWLIVGICFNLILDCTGFYMAYRFLVWFNNNIKQYE